MYRGMRLLASRPISSDDCAIRSLRGYSIPDASLDISQIQIVRLHMTVSAQSSPLANESTQDGGDERYNPGGLVSSSFPTNGLIPTVQSLPFCVDEPVAVIQGSHVDTRVP